MRKLIAFLFTLSLVLPQIGFTKTSRNPVFNVTSHEFNDPYWMFGDLVGSDGDFQDLDNILGFQGFEKLIFYKDLLARVPESQIKARLQRALIQIHIYKGYLSKGIQYLEIHQEGQVVFWAPVSTGWERLAQSPKRTYYVSTPSGVFTIDATERRRFSYTWQVWLDYVIRFNNGIWIHAIGPEHWQNLGYPASGGCVRLHPEDARIVYDYATRYPLDRIVIIVHPHNPKTEPQVPYAYMSQKPPLPPEFINWRKQKGIDKTIPNP